MSEVETATIASNERSGPPASTPSATHDTVEQKLTIHELLVATGAGPKGLDILHRDLFDNRERVVLSAIKAIGKIGQPSSARFVARLLGHVDKNTRVEAIRCLGRLKLPAAGKLLGGLYRTASDDEIRCESLTALAQVAPDNTEVRSTISELATSHLASAELRASAAVLLVRLFEPERMEGLLSEGSADVLERILTAARDDVQLAAQIVKHGIAGYERLSPASRELLVGIAASTPQSGATDIVLHALRDKNPEVRHAAYEALGKDASHAHVIPAVVDGLFDHFETTNSLEDEALAAIGRLEEIARDSEISLDSVHARKLRVRCAELFKNLSAPVNRVGSDTIELGWLMLHSRDYMEYYASEEFRSALIHYLKGGSYNTTADMLGMLKQSAERVEVRHFDGYRALGEIIKNRKRPGTALIVRDLTVAKLGKREPFGRLIRNLKLIRFSSAAGPETIDLASRIYTWAKGEKLYRLAEAALSVLAKFAPEQGKTLCRELLTPPVESKILTISAIQFVPALGAEAFVPEVERLIRSTTDTVVLLNLLDAMQAMGYRGNPQIAKAALGLLRGADDREVVSETGQFLATCNSPNLLENITAGFDRLDEWRRKVVIGLLDRSVSEKNIENREGLSEFLYKILRNSEGGLSADAAVVLWKLGDDFALKVIKRLLRSEDNGLRSEIILKLKGFVNSPLAAMLLSLLPLDHAGVHQALRETLSAVTEESVVSYIHEQITGGGENEDALGVGPEEAGIEAPIVTEKEAYRFEHEFIQELAIFFTDIQGYSRKAQVLTTMQLTSLIHDYEGILLPTVTSHRGTLVKKMGDGHLFVFDSALDAALAAIRLQKALKRFNNYREESLRVVVRVGVHWGKVVRRDGDVLGNHVNIASRLESSAKGGSTLVSKALFERLDGRIHARELGEITVKNISEPIKVFEPHEIQIDLPEELDPLRNRGRKVTSAPPSANGTSNGSSPPVNGAASANHRSEGGRTIDPETMKVLAATFASLDDLCKKVELDEIEVSALRSEIRTAWKHLKELG